MGLFLYFVMPSGSTRSSRAIPSPVLLVVAIALILMKPTFLGLIINDTVTPSLALTITTLVLLSCEAEIRKI